eukprot:TRINITY_DN97_c0_g1_i1.p1 TRINITY_DN97_c0_g1~~TRINITY_DN97_c0_g1_i1.p1  ORF type:complete len:118 (-),score=39.04 TRINITY_DN97_c0_g1_i1:34-345(-)
MSNIRDKLEGSDRESLLKEIPQWSQKSDRDAITRTFLFQDFNQAFSFMTRTALVAEKMDHHPEWFNVYNKVEVTLATHTCSGVSRLDIQLAKQMDSFAESLSK